MTRSAPVAPAQAGAHAEAATGPESAWTPAFAGVTCLALILAEDPFGPCPAPVAPAEAGAHAEPATGPESAWTPAFAGVTYRSQPPVQS
jgi:hypothetical protein